MTISNETKGNSLFRVEDDAAISAVILDDCPKCTICEGQDHHWMPDCDDNGEPVMICKHCPSWREMRDDEDFV